MQLLVKKIFKDEHFVQIGKLPRFFNPEERVSIKQFNLEMWPGFEVTPKVFASGLYLNCDTSTKFVQSKTIWEEVKEFQEQGYTNKEIEDWYLPANNKD